MQDLIKRPTDKLTIIGAGIIGALEAYFAYKIAHANGTNIRITMLDKNASIADTTVVNLAPSLTDDEIMAVVPSAVDLIKKLDIIFSRAGGIRVDDVDGVNDSKVKEDFIQQVQAYNSNPNEHKLRSEALLKLGKISMNLWQRIYAEADPELQQIFHESNFNPCREPISSADILHDGYRIDLIAKVTNAVDKANQMCNSYNKLGYTRCRVLTPDEVIALDPSLAGFCARHSVTTSTGCMLWNTDTAALFRPGGCIDAAQFLPKFYAYLERAMGTYTNQAGVIKNCFRLKFNKKVDGVIFKDSSDNIVVSALICTDKTRSDKHTYKKSEYVFCPGEAVGTLKGLSFAEPAYTGFAGATLKLSIDLPMNKIHQYKAFNHCMEVHGEGVVLAWQARYKDGKILIGVGGTKAFYADKKPDKDQAFAKNRNLLQLNMINDVLPEFISLALQRDTTSQQLSPADLEYLEKTGVATRWVGTRAVAFDGFPTLGKLYADRRLVENARTTTHLGSGGVSFGPAAVLFSRSVSDNRELFEVASEQFKQEIITYASANRRAKL